MQKYQVFISSTYDDLKVERNQVIKAVLEMGHIPVGMEMFSAADEEQWKIITRQIDESDYYVIIVAHRYGSLSGKISYTEKEFDYAQSKGIPIYGFVMDPSIEPLAKNSEKDKTKVAALNKFRTKVKQRPVSFWKNAEDLHGKVSISLMKAFNTNPRIGWVRATASTGPEVSQELSRLSKENAELRAQIAAAEVQDEINRHAQILSQTEMMKTVPVTLFLREKDNVKWDHKKETNLFAVFNTLAPEMMDEISIPEASNYLALMNADEKEIDDEAPIPYNLMNILFSDLAALDLVALSKKKHPISDKGQYWSLTSLGVETLKLNRISEIEKRASQTTKKTPLSLSS